MVIGKLIYDGRLKRKAMCEKRLFIRAVMSGLQSVFKGGALRNNTA